ncbi:MAG: CoA-binding domain protein [Clostridia bacterium]|jgi:redox-sensing transcriptional repressor|uniref:redox-sensing transcriptional repressor Rex n=1 Tax=Petroclostridium xylanilyticum TaxID=1792311 RepID=UPI000B987E82|nr:redox-sensing transcriptional repressor Rex [Petroclostridium xylanilyticum]MBZ4646177.1 CoA-binding domain protein [Clostridia bacterium]
MNYNEKKVSIAVVRRLPRYYRYLEELLKNDITRISSKELSQRMGVTASQIRQDLNCFGGFGQQGYGYNVESLYKEIGNILGLYNGYTTIIIGAGNLGRALANHTSFERRGFRLVGIFDVNREIVGKEIRGIKIMHMDDLDDFMKSNKVDIGILAIPKEGVSEVAQRLVKLGIKGLWNFSYTDLNLTGPVQVENVHLSDSLMTLSYKITQNME